jgi:hypothetical protein
MWLRKMWAHGKDVSFGKRQGRREDVAQKLKMGWEWSMRRRWAWGMILPWGKGFVTVGKWGKKYV